VRRELRGVTNALRSAVGADPLGRWMGPLAQQLQLRPRARSVDASAVAGARAPARWAAQEPRRAPPAAPSAPAPPQPQWAVALPMGDARAAAPPMAWELMGRPLREPTVVVAEERRERTAGEKRAVAAGAGPALPLPPTTATPGARLGAGAVTAPPVATALAERGLLSPPPPPPPPLSGAATAAGLPTTTTTTTITLSSPGGLHLAVAMPSSAQSTGTRSTGRGRGRGRGRAPAVGAGAAEAAAGAGAARRASAAGSDDAAVAERRAVHL
jgi:hypothetical protein